MWFLIKAYFYTTIMQFVNMMKSWQGNVFCVIGRLWDNSLVLQWIHSHKGTTMRNFYSFFFIGSDKLSNNHSSCLWSERPYPTRNPTNNILPGHQRGRKWDRVCMCCAGWRWGPRRRCHRCWPWPGTERTPCHHSHPPWKKTTTGI